MIINGTLGKDLFDLRLDKYASTTPNTVYTYDGNDTVEGSNFGELIFAGKGDDIIFGYGGNDSILADAGNDFIYGGDGNDGINGGKGDDQISGDRGDDTIKGGDGNDTLVANGGKDTLYGDAGVDQLVFTTGFQTKLTGGLDADTFTLALNDSSFVPASTSQNAYVMDFVRGEDELRIINGSETLSYEDLNFEVGSSGVKISIKGDAIGIPASAAALLPTLTVMGYTELLASDFADW